MISIIAQTVGQPRPGLEFFHPIGDEFQIGEFVIRRVRGDKFLIWNSDYEMMATDAGKLESALADFFNEEF